MAPVEIRDMMMALAWPSFQPVTALRVVSAANRSAGLILLICPTDRLLLSFPRAEMTVASMSSPKLLAKAAATYRESKGEQCSFF